MDRISRRDAKRTAESAEKDNQIRLRLFFALSAFLFASLRETSCHFESILSQPRMIPSDNHSSGICPQMNADEIKRMKIQDDFEYWPASVQFL
jgi:hypothetical protein